MGAANRLEQFNQALARVREGADTGNALHDALEQTTRDMDGADFTRAVLTLDLEQLTPFLVIWRKHLIREILEYTDPEFFYVTEKIKEIDPL